MAVHHNLSTSHPAAVRICWGKLKFIAAFAIAFPAISFEPNMKPMSCTSVEKTNKLLYGVNGASCH